MQEIFRFPNPVNEKAARVVAGVVAGLGAITLATGWDWLIAVLAYGFWARVLTGPTLSPLGRFAMKVAAPRLGPPKYVAGPPKRFAQAMGAAMTTAAGLAVLGGAAATADVLIGMLIVAATLEAAFAICLGCIVFGWLMRAGVVPDSVCAECGDIRLRRQSA